MQLRIRAVILTPAILALTLLGIVPATAQGQRSATESPVALVPSRPDGLTQAILDTVAAHLVALELQRPELLATGRSSDHPEVVAVDRRLAVLRAQLSELPNTRAVEAAINARLLRAIEARLASVTVERRLRAVDLPPSHSELQAMAALEAALQRRRSELLAAMR